MDGQKRGRPQRHWAEYLRVAIWYREIKSQSGWSDYVLDNQFAWTELGQEKRDEEGKLSTTNRPKVFEGIRKTGKRPTGRNKNNRLRSMSEIVEAIDGHELFINTKAMYQAKLWDLLQLEFIPTSTLKNEIEKKFTAFNLIHVDHESFLGLANLVDEYGHLAVYDRCLRVSLRRLGKLAAIELACYLYVRAEHAPQIRGVIESILDNKIENLFTSYFPDLEALGYAEDSIKALRSIRLRAGEYGYGYPEAIVNWPILPKELASSITSDQLFANSYFYS